MPSQAEISASWMELNWSAAGNRQVSHSHCTTAASYRAVGVSALYSSNLGGPVPSQRRSMRPYRLGSCRSQLFTTSGQTAAGMPSCAWRAWRTACSAASRQRRCSSAVASSSVSISAAVKRQKAVSSQYGSPAISAKAKPSAAARARASGLGCRRSRRNGQPPKLKK